jgi:hypothetical protein
LARYSLLLLNVGALIGPVALADPVWDPTEIAGMVNQAAQTAVNLSIATEVQLSLTRLSAALGDAGIRNNLVDIPTSQISALAGLAASAPARGVLDSLWTPIPGQSATQNRQIEARHLQMARVAAVDGLALAQMTNQTLADLPQRADHLVGAAAQAQDLRADIAADSAVALSLLAETATAEALLALLLQCRSIQYLPSAGTLSGG